MRVMMFGKESKEIKCKDPGGCADCEGMKMLIVGEKSWWVRHISFVEREEWEIGDCLILNATVGVGIWVIGREGKEAIREEK